MTSRTAPVGILVIAFAGLIAMGCNAPTHAVFQALLDPAGTAVSTPEPDGAADPGTSSGSVTWWAHPDGYHLVLPAGWSGSVVEPDQTAELVEAVTEAMPALGQRVEEVLASGPTRISAIAIEPSADAAAVVPILVVLAQPTEGRRPHAIKTEVRERISALPDLSGPLSMHDVVTPTAKGVRFDYAIDDPDLGVLRVYSYLFRASRTAYLVSFAAPAAVAADLEDTFNAIANSVRFGM
ncbi:MAG: hypothetical protein PVG27_03830 [Chloroflexota bacterium]|jgi:hypothetical protein